MAIIKIAIITGGTSGIGLDVAQRLDSTGNWKIHIIGSNKQRGEDAASPLKNTTFHQADVSSYQAQAVVFDKIFAESGRLDLVFANAGIAHPAAPFYAKQDETSIPPQPDVDGVLGINLDGAIYTSYLAMHYFRRCPPSENGSRHLILTSSIGGLYPCMNAPIYVATKHALVGFTRSMGKKLREEGVKMNAICPGVVETPLVTPEIKAFFDERIVIPMSEVTDVVMEMMAGKAMVDSQGTTIPGEELYQRAILISGKNHYFVEMPEIYDEETRITWNGMMN
ncbi:hypothetical protein N7466_003798 [Penicillium verhagenii]|uniref:uncharacterized protein n=1 Tax=Penicillium verhagenii TaxID=1562060 RepID=UPI002545A38A|nr:uncharacterized protein N7466_003798 [Penicillium verhagenii]KAJ5934251.1 hypothetical protein N7466_003798 [Penicillium verhagenii]